MHESLSFALSAVAEVLAVHSDLQYAKCVSAYHGKTSFPLLALGKDVMRSEKFFVLFWFRTAKN